MNDKIGKKVLVTTEGWFFAPDGKNYKAAWGTLHAIHTAEETLGFKPNVRHTNWYLQIGNITIAGCQVLYMVEASEVNTGEALEFTTERTHFSSSGTNVAEAYIRPSNIYNANLCEPL